MSNEARSSERGWFCYVLTGVVAVVVLFLLVSSVLPAARRNYYWVRYQQSMSEPVSLQAIAENTSEVQDADLQRIAGVSLLTASQPRAALDPLQQAVAMRTDDSLLLYWLGVAFEEGGNYGDALVVMHRRGDEGYFPSIDSLTGSELETLGRRLVGEPISPWAQLELAEHLYPVNKVLALDYFKAATRSEELLVVDYLSPAWFYYNEDEIEIAQEFGDRAEELFPNSPWVYLFQGASLRRIGEAKRAQNTLEYALSLAEDVPTAAYEAHLALSSLLSDTGSYHLALNHLDEAEQLQPNQPAVWLRRAVVFARLNECSNATAQLENMHEVTDGSLETYVEQIKELCP